MGNPLEEMQKAQRELIANSTDREILANLIQDRDREGGGFMLTEYDASELWKWAARMVDEGYLTSEGIYTGTVGFKLTEDGLAMLKGSGDGK